MLRAWCFERMIMQAAIGSAPACGALYRPASESARFACQVLDPQDGTRGADPRIVLSKRDKRQRMTLAKEASEKEATP
jgi:hypothetical protein